MNKIFYDKDKLIGKQGGLTESVFFMPFENSEIYQEGGANKNRFDKVIKNGKKLIGFSNKNEADFWIYPYKWNGENEYYKKLLSDAKNNEKKIIVLYNDDNEAPLNLDKESVIVFRTSLNRINPCENEFAFPAFCSDFFDNGFFIEKKHNQMTIGFCGQALIPIRRIAIQKARKIDFLQNDFILRKGFWAPEIVDKNTARKQYIDNLKHNLFNVCARGAGNFSYRFYETFMMGRIPVFIDTNQKLPFENIIDYNKQCIIIKEEEINEMGFIIKNWILNKKDLYLTQKENRKIWEEYLSPYGWLKNFKKEIE